VFPGAVEGAGDGIDADCDGAEVCYADFDGDGFRSDATVLSDDSDCADAGEALADAASGDCDDADGGAYPGAVEGVGDGIDGDCDGGEVCYVDADDDGYVADDAGTVASASLACDGAGEAPASALAGDCDDADAAYNPGAAEDDCADPADYNCDGSSGYADADADGFAACEECDDGSALVYPGAFDAPGDTVDADCDGLELCYVDGDGDGFRADDRTVTGADLSCSGSGEALASAPDGDCDDADAAVSPAAAELAGDGVDQDCDGMEDCYVDADGDGVRPDGGATVASADLACDGAGEASASASEGDCDDASAVRYPGAPETDCLDPVDYNCDGASGRVDGDADGFAACEECDDAASAVNPDAAEVCNGRDDDCDGAVDVDAADATIWYADADADGYTDPEVSTFACEAPEGYAAASSVADCDDADATSNPGAEDVPGDGVDQDCDGVDAEGGGDADSGLGEDTGANDGSTDDPDGDAKGTGCACGTSADPASVAWAMLVTAVALSRRGRRTA
jgi:hypothetical protein